MGWEMRQHNHEELLLEPKNNWELDWARVKRTFPCSAGTVYGEACWVQDRHDCYDISRTMAQSRADTLTSHSATTNAASGAQYDQKSIQWRGSGFESRASLCLITMGQDVAGDSFVRAPRHDGFREDIT